MIRDGLLLLVMLNPFATMLYLTDLMQRRSSKEFAMIYWRAAVFTVGTLYVFALTGDLILSQIFQVSLPAVQIFGGITIFMAAYTYIMHGPQGLRLFEGDVTTVAQHIALPFLVGPGAIWVSIGLGRDYGPGWSLGLIVTASLINALSVLGYEQVIKQASGRHALTRMVSYFQMLMRLNALLIGAVAVQMILEGIQAMLRA